jgi:hypothetical protein
MPDIKILEGGGFVDCTVTSTTVGDLKREQDIPTGSTVSVGGSNRNDSYPINDGDLVAAVHNDKTGGDKE